MSLFVFFKKVSTFDKLPKKEQAAIAGDAEERSYPSGRAKAPTTTEGGACHCGVKVK